VGTVRKCIIRQYHSSDSKQFISWTEARLVHWVRRPLFALFSQPRIMDDYGMTSSGETEEKLSEYHFIHHKSHTSWFGIEPGPSLREAGNYLPGQWHGPSSTV
jgi:hypothetical protein